MRTQGGYTLLFAVLTATLVLGVAAFIVGLSQKQYQLSVSARNSIYSFYAADSGIECAVNQGNWTNTGGFASTTGGSLSCGSGSVTLAAVGAPAVSPAGIVTGTAQNPIHQWTGYIPLTWTDGTTAMHECVSVTYTTGTDPVSGKPMTIIDSRGYNLCTTGAVGPDTSNVATTERAIRLVQNGVW